MCLPELSYKTTNKPAPKPSAVDSRALKKDNSPKMNSIMEEYICNEMFYFL